MAIWIAGGIAALVIFWVISVYNGLVKLRVLCRNAWSDIDVHLKKRHNLIPNLVNTVKGYASHESETLEKVIQARKAAVQAPEPAQQIPAENMISSMIPKIFALAEQYPDLKANENFRDLQNQLSIIEGGIAQSRRYYNAVVRDFNTKQQLFPASIIAGMFAFKLEKFFEVEAPTRAMPKVEF